MEFGDKRFRKPFVAGSSPAGGTSEIAPFSKGVAMAQRRIAFPTDWIFYPDWLTVEQACHLSGWDTTSMLEIMDVGGVDLDDAERIHKDSLWDFQEACALVAHWND